MLWKEKLMKIDFVIPCLLGVEGLIADELRFLGAENVCAENGRVLFSGDENILARVNICSHFAERVQINMGSFTAKTLSNLLRLLLYEGIFGTRSFAMSRIFSKRDFLL